MIRTWYGVPSWYWKVGAYAQANSDTGDANSTGAVTVYGLQVHHSDTATGHTDNPLDAGTSSGAEVASRSPAADTGASDKTNREQDGAGRSDTPTTSESTSESSSASGSDY